MLHPCVARSVSAGDEIADETTTRHKTMPASHARKEVPPKNSDLQNTKFLGFEITADFLLSYLYGKNKIKPVERQQLLQEKAEKHVQKRCQLQTNYIASSENAKSMCSARDSTEAVLTYALKSFPNEVQLCQSSIPGTGYGVCTKRRIPRDTWIGPYEGRRISPDDITRDMDTSYVWEIYENGKLACYINGSDENSSSWMRFIRCARHEKEQNLSALQYKGNIFYRAFREIPPGEEMLVWYDSKYHQHMGIPIGLQEISFINLSDSQEQEKQFLEKDTENLSPQQPLENIKPAVMRTKSAPAGFAQLPVGPHSMQHGNNAGYSSTARSHSEGISPICSAQYFSEWFQSIKENMILGQRMISDPGRTHPADQREPQAGVKFSVSSATPYDITSNSTTLNPWKLRGKRKLLALEDEPVQVSLETSQARFFFAPIGYSLNPAVNKPLPDGVSPHKLVKHSYSEEIKGPNTQQYSPTPQADQCTLSKDTFNSVIDLYSPSKSANSSTSNVYDANTPVVSPVSDVYSPRKAVISPTPNKSRFSFDEIPPSPTEPYSPTKPRMSPNLPVTTQSRYSPTDEIQEWKCGQCHKTFTQRVLLQNHVCPKQPLKPYKCGHCSETFANPSDLRIHVVKHTSEKSFKCGFCSRAFAGATTLNNHIRTHTGEKPFGCERCGSSFSQPSHLARHLRVSGECVSTTNVLTAAAVKNRKLSEEL